MGKPLDDSDPMPAGAVNQKQARMVPHPDAVLSQARLLDAHVHRLARSHDGKFVVFHDGKVLAAGDTAEDALAQVRREDQGLPFVIRFVSSRHESEFMGGPKGE